MNKFILLAVLSLVLIPTSVDARTEMACTMQYEPVCGAQPVQCVTTPCYPQYHTYGNSCVLANEGGTYIHDGECTESETGPVKTAIPYTPPANCTAWFDGCNSCSRSEKGYAMCTMRACVDEPAPGYCTAYEKPTIDPTLPVLQGPDLTQTAPDTPAATTAATPTPQTETINEKSFFSRMWDVILGWFSW